VSSGESTTFDLFLLLSFCFLVKSSFLSPSSEGDSIIAFDPAEKQLRRLNGGAFFGIALPSRSRMSLSSI
jgi:hypothetical protein